MIVIYRAVNHAVVVAVTIILLGRTRVYKINVHTSHKPYYNIYSVIVFTGAKYFFRPDDLVFKFGFREASGSIPGLQVYGQIAIL